MNHNELVTSDKLSSVVEFIRRNLDVALSLHSDEETPRTRRSIQHFSLLKLRDAEEQALYEIILRHSIAAEVACPGAGEALLRKIINDSTGSILSPKNRTEVFSLLERSNFSPIVLSILDCLLDMSNSTTKITLKKTSTSSLYVEVTQGYSFTVKPLLRSSFEASKSKVACIDGYVESVSELHHLLESLSLDKMPCLIAVRGMSDDVLNTLKVNNDRGTLSVCPVVIPFDVENVNTIVDLAVVSGTDVTSSLKGQLISSIALKDLGSVDNVKISNNNLRIRNNSSKERVERHLAQIRLSQREKDASLTDVLQHRVRSLTSSCIDVCIPDDINYYSRIQQLSEGIRIISCLLSKNYDLSTVVDVHYDAYSSTVKDAVSLLL